VVAEACRLVLKDATRSIGDGQQDQPQEQKAESEQEIQAPRVTLDGLRDRPVGEVQLEDALGMIVRAELERHVHLEQPTVLLIDAQGWIVAGLVGVEDLGRDLAVECLLELVVTGIGLTDQPVCVRVDDPLVGVPDADRRHLLAQEVRPERAIDLPRVGVGQASAEVARRQQREDAEAAHHLGGDLGVVEGPIADLSLERAAEEETEQDQREEAEHGELPEQAGAVPASQAAEHAHRGGANPPGHRDARHGCLLLLTGYRQVGGGLEESAPTEATGGNGS
jgi:hypothetical protein